MTNAPKIILSDLGEVLLFPTELAKLHPMFVEQRKMNPVYAALEKAKSEDKNFKYDFNDYFTLNVELLEHMKKLKEQGIEFFMLTEGSIQNDPAISGQLGAVFTRIYSANSEFDRMKKTDPKLYEGITQAISAELGSKLAAKDVVFVDDSEGNILAAKTAGLLAEKFMSTKELIEKLDWREGRPSLEGTVRG